MHCFTTCRVLLLLTTVLSSSGRAADWRQALYLPGDGYWRARIAVTVTNSRPAPLDGETAGLIIGREPGQLDLVDAQAQAVRVCTASGAECLYGLLGADGQTQTIGPIKSGGTLVVPLVCPAQATSEFFIYFDNPTAGRVPDHLAGRTGLMNGDVEEGNAGVPFGWQHDEPDGQHRASWSAERSQSGRRCLKTEVAAGAEPTWIATRQSGIQATAGARYVLTAWTRGENVVGQAGWYVHVSDAKHPQLLGPVIKAGSGTFDWKPIRYEFTAPPTAERISLGTVLRGTGKAWFDNARLECFPPPSAAKLTVGRPERITLQGLQENMPWHGPSTGPQAVGDHRAILRLFNFDSNAQPPQAMHVDLATVANRMRGRLQRESLLLVHAGQSVPFELAGQSLSFVAARPARNVAQFELYFSDDKSLKRPAGAPQPVAGLRRNLLANGSFESGTPLPNAWKQNSPGPGVHFGLDEPGAPGCGQRAAKLDVPAGTPPGWRGWTQTVAVQGGKTYLLSGWLKCRELAAGEATIHLHLHDARGRLCSSGGMSSLGQGVHGTADWTFVSRTLSMPPDAAKLAIHLTMNTSGTLWHDGLELSEITPAAIVRLDGRPLDAHAPLHVWPLPAIQKVFPDDPAPRTPIAARLALACNEKEPLQLAVRSPREIATLRVEAGPLVGPRGAQLEAPTINVVGYVPIDYPSNYYSLEVPAWQRKIPQQPAACDGWAGLWPDPLLPQTELPLPANSTRAVWVTVAASKAAVAGDYTGRIRLLSAGQLLAEVPLQVHVWNFMLPEENHLKAIYDVRPTGQGNPWGGPPEEVHRQMTQFLAARRLSPDKISPTPKIRYVHGRVEADFTAFDRAAAYCFDTLKIAHSYTPECFYLFGWGHPPAAKFGEPPYPGEFPYDGADRGTLRPEFKRAYQACLRTFWDHLRQKGWQNKFTLYISDEPFYTKPHIQAQMRALCAMIREVDPQIPIYSSTWHHVPEWDGALTVWGAGHYGVFPVDKLAAVRAGGARLWFTTDGQMCTDTPYCAVERLLPHYCFKYGAEAYEFWGATWLTYDPYGWGWHAFIHQSSEPGKFQWVRYPNGDGFLIYPGGPIGQAGLVSSIRLEQAREGVEDFEYLHMLRSLVERAKQTGRNTVSAEAALQQAATLVDIPNAGGRCSSKFLLDPQAVYEVRTRVAEAIEALGRP